MTMDREVEAQEDNNLFVHQANELINKYGDKMLKGRSS